MQAFTITVVLFICVHATSQYLTRVRVKNYFSSSIAFVVLFFVYNLFYFFMCCMEGAALTGMLWNEIITLAQYTIGYH